MVDNKYYLVSFNHQTGQQGLYDVRLVGLIHKQYAPLDCPSGKSLSVSFCDPLGEGVQSIWVSDMDDCQLIEVSEDEYWLYDMYLKEEKMK